jgi:hypothetical protein
MTTTQKLSIQGALNEANPSRAWAAVQLAKLGDAMRGFQKTLTGLTAAASFDLTTIDDPDDTSIKLPAALVIGSVRVTAGAAAAGVRQISDAGDTPSATLATLSDDGKTITFEGNVTAFIINYIPKEDLSVDFEVD